jgi:anaerobic C4-dicarboxylate transporter
LKPEKSFKYRILICDSGISALETEIITFTNPKKGEIIMYILNFIIAVVALIIAIAAFQRTGGVKNLKKNTAELLARVEKKMREESPDVKEE